MTSHDPWSLSTNVTSAMLVSHKNNTAVMLVSPTGPMGVYLVPYALFCRNNFALICIHLHTFT